METNASVTVTPPELDTTVRLSIMAEDLRPALKHLLKLVKAAKSYSSYAELISLQLEDEHILLSATDGYCSYTLSCPTILAENLPARVSVFMVREWLDAMPQKGPTTLIAEPDDRTFPNLAQIDPGAGDGSWVNRKYLIEALQALDGAEAVQVDTNGQKPLRLTPISPTEFCSLPGFVLVQPLFRNDTHQSVTPDD